MTLLIYSSVPEVPTEGLHHAVSGPNPTASMLLFPAVLFPAGAKVGLPRPTRGEVPPISNSMRYRRWWHRMREPDARGWRPNPPAKQAVQEPARVRGPGHDVTVRPRLECPCSTSQPVVAVAAVGGIILRHGIVALWGNGPSRAARTRAGDMWALSTRYAAVSPCLYSELERTRSGWASRQCPMWTGPTRGGPDALSRRHQLHVKRRCCPVQEVEHAPSPSPGRAGTPGFPPPPLCPRTLAGVLSTRRES